MEINTKDAGIGPFFKKNVSVVLDSTSKVWLVVD